MSALATTLVGVLGLLPPARASAEYVCPVFAPAAVSEGDARYASKPVVDCAFKFVNGVASPWLGKTDEVSSPVHNATTGARAVIGAVPSMGADEALEAVQAAAAAWDRGQGAWPRLPLARRIAAVEDLVVELRAMRPQMVAVLEWDIAKTSADAAAEFDRTLQFVAAVIAELKRDPNLGQARLW